MTVNNDCPDPGYALLHPVALASILVLVVNDHFLKEQLGDVVTGKLSDFAGLVFFPLLLGTIAAPLFRRQHRLRVDQSTILLGAIVATALVFAAINLLEVAEGAFEVGLGMLQYPWRLASGGSYTRIDVTRDPSDLIAFASLGAAWWIGRRGYLTRAQS